MVLKGIDEAISSYCAKRHEGDRIGIRRCYDEMESYLNMYSDDILDVTGTRQEERYCIGNISFVTMMRKRLFESVYPGFVDFLGKLVVIRRVYVADVYITCCLDASVRYEPVMKRFYYIEDIEEGEIEETIGQWLKKYAVPGLRDVVLETGDDKCKTLSPSLYLCDWFIARSDAWEERE